MDPLEYLRRFARTVLLVVAIVIFLKVLWAPTRFDVIVLITLLLAWAGLFTKPR